MNKQEIKSNVYNASLINCTEDEYKGSVRSDLQKISGEFINAGDGMRAQIALMEVKRLDEKFQFIIHGVKI